MSFVAICALLAACADPPSAPSRAESVREPHPGFTLLGADIVSPYYGGLDKPAYLLLRSSEEWAALWSEIEPRTSRAQGQTSHNPVPAIDFGKHALIVAAAGSKPTGCCTVEIQSLSESSERLLVTVLEKEAGANCMTTQAFTYPIAIAVIPKTAKPVDFNIVRRVENCD
jgi:hypothetical protein